MNYGTVLHCLQSKPPYKEGFTATVGSTVKATNDSRADLGLYFLIADKVA